MKPGRSLKARALQWLAQREHSRVELRRKLLVHLARAAATADAHVEGDMHADVGETSEARASGVDDLLDWLEARQYLSSERFVDSRIHARAPRFGNLRIGRELRAHHLAPSAEATAALAGSELARARAVCARKFPAPAWNASELARRARFLTGRGFSFEVVRRVVRVAGAEPEEGESGDHRECVRMEAEPQPAFDAVSSEMVRARS